MHREPAHDLRAACAAMRWRVESGAFALVGFSEPPVDADLRSLADPPAQIVREGGETTVLLRSEGVPALLERHPAARVEPDLCWFRFEMPMSWELVGFLALVTGELAAAGVPLGAVCGYSRDHLFLARRHRDAARSVLARLFPESEA